MYPIFPKEKGILIWTLYHIHCLWAEGNKPDQVIGVSKRKISKIKADALKTNTKCRQDVCIYLRNWFKKQSQFKLLTLFFKRISNRSLSVTSKSLFTRFIFQILRWIISFHWPCQNKLLPWQEVIKTTPWQVDWHSSTKSPTDF